MIDSTKPFPAVRPNGKKYHGRLDWLRKLDASGVYAIIDASTKAVLYVGESHTGRLYDTITRHFRQWSTDPRTDASGRRRGGTMYHRDRVMIAYTLCEPGEALALQNREIKRLRPLDNGTCADGCGDADDLPV